MSDSLFAHYRDIVLEYKRVRNVIFNKAYDSKISFDDLEELNDLARDLYYGQIADWFQNLDESDQFTIVAASVHDKRLYTAIRNCLCEEMALYRTIVG